MDRLSQILWFERDLLVALAGKLDIERTMVADGRTSWLAQVTREIEGILDDIRVTEVLRAMVADEVAEQVGIVANPSLRALADAVAEPWHAILIEHRDQVLGLATAVPSRVAQQSLLEFLR